jgi:hypothetical protein
MDRIGCSTKKCEPQSDYFPILGPQNYKNEFLGWLVPKKSRICIKIWKSFAGPRCGKLRPNFESCSEQGTQTYWGTSVDHTGRSRHWFVSFVYDIFEYQRSHSGISSWHLFQGYYCQLYSYQIFPAESMFEPSSEGWETWYWSETFGSFEITRYFFHFSSI